MIQIYVRDINGKRGVWDFSTNYDFVEWCTDEYNDVNMDEYEIQMVIYDGYCIYSGLVHAKIIFEDLLGFFA